MRRIEVTIEADEVAVDLLVADDMRDPVDCSGMTLGGKPGTLRSMHLFEPVVPVVESKGEMGGGPAGLPSSNRPVI